QIGSARFLRERSIASKRGFTHRVMTIAALLIGELRPTASRKISHKFFARLPQCLQLVFVLDLTRPPGFEVFVRLSFVPMLRQVREIRIELEIESRMPGRDQVMIDIEDFLTIMLRTDVTVCTDCGQHAEVPSVPKKAGRSFAGEPGFQIMR